MLLAFTLAPQAQTRSKRTTTTRKTAVQPKKSTKKKTTTKTTTTQPASVQALQNQRQKLQQQIKEQENEYKEQFRYFNLAGQEIYQDELENFNIYIVVTIFQDGKCNAVKVYNNCKEKYEKDK